MSRNPRPTTPSIMMLGSGGSPNSPPHSPTSASPMIDRNKFTSRHLPPYHNMSRSALLEDSSIQPMGTRHQFSFTPSNRFAQPSPRTSSEDSDNDEEESESEAEEIKLPKAMSEDDEEDSDDDEDAEDEDVQMGMQPAARAPRPSTMSAPTPPPRPHLMQPPASAPRHPPRMAVDSGSDADSDDEEEDDESDSDFDSEPDVTASGPEPCREILTENTKTAISTTRKANFTLEELSDFDPMDHDRTGTIAPTGFSSPASARSRSRAPAPKPTELPQTMIHDMRNLNCSVSDVDSSDEYLDEDAAHREFVRTQRELKMRKRLSHGSSIGKRTISERSDSEHEDCTPLDADTVGSSARRLRRRVSDRRSFIHLQFQDPPPPRIDELDEPESEVEVPLYLNDDEALARELPYYLSSVVEYQSSSP